MIPPQKLVKAEHAAVVGRAFGEWKVNMPSSSVSGCRQYIAVRVDDLDGCTGTGPGSVKHVKQRALRALAEPGYRTILKWTFTVALALDQLRPRLRWPPPGGRAAARAAIAEQGDPESNS
jgi:hypothetical protein